MSKTQHTVIIGGTKGIGRALTKILVQEKQTLSIVGRHKPENDFLKKDNIHFWTLDLKENDRIHEVCEEIALKNGKINNLIFFQRFRGEGDDWQGEIDVSLTATKNIIDYFADKFNEKQDKAIVITSSIASLFVAEEQPLSYHVAKAGLNQMVRFYATSLGTKGIRVNAISSGTVLKEESKHFYEQNQDLLNLYREITPLGRMVEADEIAQLIIFLISNKASFITGQNIVIDGGVSLQGHETLARRLKSPKMRKVTQ